MLVLGIILQQKQEALYFAVLLAVVFFLNNRLARLYDFYFQFTIILAQMSIQLFLWFNAYHDVKKRQLLNTKKN